jgi:outer membrane immunogenic protein
MKKVLLASVATIATVSAFSAFAADLPSRKAAPVYAPPPPMWTGFYAGLNAGYNFGTNSNASSVAYGFGGTAGSVNPWDEFTNRNIGLPVGAALSGMSSMTQSGFIGGGQVGYNYQWGSNIVVGLEADIQGAGIRGTGVSNNGASAVLAPATDNNLAYYSTAFGGNVINAGVDWMGTVRGRVGYLWTPTMLVYATGGLTYGGVHASVASSAVANGNGYAFPPTNGTWTQTYVGGARQQSNVLVGWNAGGGVEWMFMPNWSLKAEAFYWDMGNMQLNTATVAAPTRDSFNYALNAGSTFGRTSGNYQGVTARAGVNYHFDWGAAPVVASY